MPQVSVGICAKNAGQYIGLCIKSLLTQSVHDIEIIVVDDPPFDNTEEILSRYQDRRIKYFKNSKPLGIADSRNRCLNLSTGKYMFFTDSDCAVAPDWIEKGLQDFNKPDCLGVEGLTYYISKDYQPTYADRSYVQNTTGGEFMTCNIGYKKETLTQIGGFDGRYCGSEDRNLALRVMKLGKIHFNREMIVFHQKRTKQLRDYIHIRSCISRIHPRVLLYKDFGEKGTCFWRITNPLGLAKMIFPPAILVSLIFSTFKTTQDYALLPFEYLFVVSERLQLWHSCASEKVFLI